MSMQVIEKRVWCFTVTPVHLSILEDADGPDEELIDEEESDPEDVLGPDDEEEESDDFEDIQDDEDFEVRLIVDYHTTIDRVLELFNASRAVLGVGPNDSVTGLIAESTASQLRTSPAN